MLCDILCFRPPLPCNNIAYHLHFIDYCSSFLSPNMDSSRRPSGIQQLLAAEQEAQQIVNTARAGKVLLFLA